MAKDLNIRAIAEGVETFQNVALLKNHGCYYVQGYYYARPMPEINFLKLIKKHNEIKEKM